MMIWMTKSVMPKTMLFTLNFTLIIVLWNLRLPMKSYFKAVLVLVVFTVYLTFSFNLQLVLLPGVCPVLSIPLSIHVIRMQISLSIHVIGLVVFGMTDLVIQIIMFYSLCYNIVIYPLLIKIWLAFALLVLLENLSDFPLLSLPLFTLLLWNWSIVIFGDHPMSLPLMAFYTILPLLMLSLDLLGFIYLKAKLKLSLSLRNLKPWLNCNSTPKLKIFRLIGEGNFTHWHPL